MMRGVVGLHLDRSGTERFQWASSFARAEYVGP